MELLSRHGREKYSTVPLLERSWNVCGHEIAFGPYHLIVSLLFCACEWSISVLVNDTVSLFDLLTAASAAKDHRWKPPKRDSQLTVLNVMFFAGELSFWWILLGANWCVLDMALDLFLLIVRNIILTFILIELTNCFVSFGDSEI